MSCILRSAISEQTGCRERQKRRPECGVSRFKILSLDDTFRAVCVVTSLWLESTSSSCTFHILIFCASTRLYPRSSITMAPATSLSADDKAKVKKAIPTSSSTNKIITATVARIYQAKPGATSCVSSFGRHVIDVKDSANRWVSSGWQMVVLRC